jgi:hypothetical protein
MYATNRAGFAMIMAIFVVVLVGMGGVLLLSGSSVGSKSVGDNYVKAQEELLAKSATEFALMRAQGAAANCLNNLDIVVNDSNGAQAYAIAVRLQYSFSGAIPAGGCNVLTSGTGSSTMVLIDAEVTTTLSTTEPIRVIKRSWQKL